MIKQKETKMKAGFCLHGTWVIERPELLKVLDEIDCDGVEIWQQAFEAIGLKGVVEKIEPYSFEVAALNPYMDFTTSEESFSESVKLAETFLDYASALDCKRIRTFTSKMGSFKTSDEAEPVHWERAIKGIQTVADMAAEKDILCTMEVHAGDGQLYDTSEATLRILEGVDRKNVIVNLQPPLRGEDALDSARRLGAYVQHLHAHNWRGGWGKFTYLDSGDVDFPKYLDILRGHGFDGYISIEHASYRDTIEIARHEIPYLKRLIASKT
ncbi:TPA: sugar phosphate isomerase/epimerase [Candidatus Poribacteria bacterium]|nr:sugar phosphate isomerase/epimerase [Candidatus Poribacteria bacterium]